jgi:hypothetical protein
VRQRGAFLIYPDWTVGGVRDYDADAIAFAKVLLPALTRHAGIPQWRDGVMSETRTNVAIVEQARLGFFNKSNTPAAREQTTRFLVEHLHHSNPAELARMKNEADLPQRIGRAYVAAIAQFYGIDLGDVPDAGKVPVGPPEDPNSLRLEVPNRGEFWIVEPILTYWENCGRVYDNPNALGWPVTGMYEEDGALVQYFDRGRVEVRGTQITSGLVGLEAAKAAGKAA